MTRDNLESAELAADRVTHKHNLNSLPIDPIAFGRSLGIEVIAKPSRDRGVSGMLIRVGNNFAIAYGTHIDNEPFQRFSVAHELGHYFLEGHVEAIFSNGIHESRAGFRSDNKYEKEADGFAAAFLMPRRLFRSALSTVGEGLEAIIRLGELCKSSLHATAIRYTQCTRDPMAIIVSRGGLVDHCFMSDALKEFRGLQWLRKGELLPIPTLTHTFNSDRANIASAARTEGTSQLQEWFGGHHGFQIREEVIGLGSYARTLTVLSEIETTEDADEDDEDELMESWTPHFR